MKKYAIVSRYDTDSKVLAQKINQSLCAHGYVEDESLPDTVFVVGGDGTFLNAVAQYFARLDQICFYGIHTGTLGFFTDYKEEEVEEFLETFYSESYKEVSYPLLKAIIDGHKYYALNEIRIENTKRTQYMDVYVDGDFFETLRGTGICVASQLGSTAYNRALGGAVIQEGLDLIEMSEIAGIHHSKYRSLGAPIVMKREVKIKLVSDSFEDAIIGYDSKIDTLDGVKEIQIEVCRERKVRMLRGKDVSYFKRLQSLF